MQRLRLERLPAAVHSLGSNMRPFPTSLPSTLTFAAAARAAAAAALTGAIAATSAAAAGSSATCCLRG